MVPIVSLWLPIILSAAAVFIVSFVFHAVIGYHNSDFQGLPDEDKIRAAFAGGKIPKGDYVIPYEPDHAKHRTPEFMEKVKNGPVAFMTVRENKMPSMVQSLGQWFAYCLVVSIFSAYITSRAIGTNATFLNAFRFAGVTAFLGYTVALWQDSIWFGRKWSTTVKNTIDGLMYALVTAGVFGWLMS
jgi:hypothetical protein